MLGGSTSRSSNAGEISEKVLKILRVQCQLMTDGVSHFHQQKSMAMNEYFQGNFQLLSYDRTRLSKNHLVMMTSSLRLVFVLQILGACWAFTQPQYFAASSNKFSESFLLSASTEDASSSSGSLFQGEEEDMFPLVTQYVDARYTAFAQRKEAFQPEVCTLEDVSMLLKSLLPPVTQQELEYELNNVCEMILQMDPESTADRINPLALFQAIPYNSYWQYAGSRVVKELIMFDCLYTYYQTQISVLGDAEFDVLLKKLQEEGSLVPRLDTHECAYIVAVCSIQRGQPKLTDQEFSDLQQYVTEKESWLVTTDTSNLDMNTFLGYVWRNIQ